VHGWNAYHLGSIELRVSVRRLPDPRVFSASFAAEVRFAASNAAVVYATLCSAIAARVEVAAATASDSATVVRAEDG